jgi:hypothetical protein
MKIQVGASTLLGYRPRGKTAIRRGPKATAGAPKGCLDGREIGRSIIRKKTERGSSECYADASGGERSPRIMIGTADQCLDAVSNRLPAYAALARVLPLAAAFVLFAARFHQVRF